ncbi:MAG: TonB-dependent siderophore receptor [Croceibacterium sp.]
MATSIALVRSALLSATVLTATPALAADAGEAASDQRIVVTAKADSYGSDDGSTATKTPTQVIDAPQTMTVITREQLDDQNVQSLNDALRYVPGVTLDTGEGHRDQVFIRGQSSTADFFLDGLRDDAQYYRSLYNVERVEILKGANALIFGRGGGGGAINRVSKKADPMAMFAQLQGSVDLNGAFNLAADVNQPLADGIAGRVNAAYERFANSRDVYEGRFIGVSPTISALLGPSTRLTATYSYDDDRRVTDRGLPSLNGRPLAGYDRTFFGDPDYNDSFARVHIGRARIDHQLTDAVSVNGTVQYAGYDKFYANIEPVGATATTVRLQGYESGNMRENLIGQVNFVARFDTGGLANTLLVGGEAGRQDSSARRNNARFGTLNTVTVPLAQVISVPTFTLVPQSASRSELSTLSAYAQEQLDIGILQLVAGLRFDRFDIATANLITGFAPTRADEGLSPRFGAILKPRPNLSLYSSYGTSFLPQSGDQFSVLNPVTAVLDPETFKNIETGVKWAIRPQLLFTAAVFRLDRANTQAPDPANPGFVLLTGATRVEGFEASLAGDVLPGLQVSLGYTYLDGQVRSTTAGAPAGRRLAQLPEHQVSAWARYKLSERFGIGAGVVHQSEQFTSLSNAVVLPAYTRVDAALFFDVSKGFGLQLNVENLFDAGYYASAHGDNNIQPGEPLTATVSAKLKL